MPFFGYSINNGAPKDYGFDGDSDAVHLSDGINVETAHQVAADDVDGFTKVCNDLFYTSVVPTLRSDRDLVRRRYPFMILPEESLGHIGGNGNESQQSLLELVNRRGENINSHVALKNGYAVIRHNATKILGTTMEDFLEQITEIFHRDPGKPEN
jgi:hypothetical protein